MASTTGITTRSSSAPTETRTCSRVRPGRATPTTAATRMVTATTTATSATSTWSIMATALTVRTTAPLTDTAATVAVTSVSRLSTVATRPAGHTAKMRRVVPRRRDNILQRLPIQSAVVFTLMTSS